MWQLYVGVAGESIKFTKYDESPSMEIDAYGGVRATFGSFTADVGANGYIYPLSTPTPGGLYGVIFPTNPTFVEGYVKLGYTINDFLSVGANYFGTPNYLDTGSPGNYLSGTAKVTLPANFSVSGEFGHQWLGTTDLTHFALVLPDYNTWNVGISYQYRFVTLDLRYWDSDLSKSDCSLITGPSVSYSATISHYCDARIVGTASFALTSKDVGVLH
jgi:uncharacterized protein (TIGR02001 family)